MTLTYATLCSGVEAVSLAVDHLDMQPVFFSEIEKFPNAVLAERFPDVPNLGDLTKIDGRPYHGRVNVLWASTPCQAFSFAGRRQGIKDARGALTLSFVDLADEIEPDYILWENVKGVFSDKNNAFGCLLGALAGEDEALLPPGGKWTHAGYVLGPKRAIAWRLLDAQHFGVPQRRERVFLVACPRDGTDPRKILFECEGVRRDSPPSREEGAKAAGIALSGFEGAGEGAPVNALTATGVGTCGADDNQAQAGHLVPGMRLAYGRNNTQGPIDTSGALTSSKSHRYDFETDTFIMEVEPSECIGFSCKDYGADAVADLSPTMRAMSHAETWPNAGGQLAVVYREPVEAYQCHGSNVGPMGTLRAGNGNESGGVPFIPVVYDPKSETMVGGVYDPEIESFDSYNQTSAPVTHTLRAGKACDEVPAVAYPAALRGRDDGAELEIGEPEIANCLRASQGGGDKPMAFIARAWRAVVRRLTPKECERLQGMPDDWTRIPYGKKSADQCPDGPRYKAIGNSLAVPCVRWIFERLVNEDRWREVLDEAA